MTQRERVLAGCLLGAVVGFGGYKLVKSQVVEPRRALIADIQKERARRDELEVRLNAADKTKEAWQAQTKQTLHVDWAEARAVFRRDVTTLLDRNNLITDTTRVRPIKEDIKKTGPWEGFVEVPLSVDGVRGTLSDLVNFLRDLYQRPYLVRVDSLRLSADRGRRSAGRKDKAAVTDLQVNIVMTISTLVLPKLPDLEHPTFDLVGLDDPNSEQLFVSAARLRAEDVEAYNEIARVNFFEPYQPPVARQEVKQRPVVKRQETPKPPPPPPDPRRDADKWVLSGIGRLDDGPIAYVINSDQPLNPPTEYRLNDAADDGNVVLLVSEGMVVRVPPSTGRRQPPKNFFYPLGCNFKEREEVNPAEHPEVARLLRLVLKQ